jgi:hypothetical protein
MYRRRVLEIDGRKKEIEIKNIENLKEHVVQIINSDEARGYGYKHKMT